MFGAAVFRCDRFWTCDVNAAPKSTLKPVKATPGSFVVSNTLTPRLSWARRYWMVIGRPVFQDDSAAAAAASSADSSIGVAFGADVVSAGAAGRSENCCAA